MIKFSAVNFKSNFNIVSRNMIRKPILNNHQVSFGQYDYFKKSGDDSNSTFVDSNKFTYLESQKDDVKQEDKNFSYLNKVNTQRTDINAEDLLAPAAIVGGAFLLSIALADIAAKVLPANNDELFTQDGYYIGNADDFNFKPSDVQTDLKGGTLKIKGTGINIDKSRYDASISDPENGIFKSSDGKLDIDLANNKYIDQINGIIVDQAQNISAFTNANGELRNIPLQNFGSGYPTRPEDIRWSDYHPADNTELSQSIETYINEHNIQQQTAKDIIQYADDIRLKEYILDNMPDLADKVSLGSIDQFIENIHANGVNYDTANGLIDIVNNNDDICII